MAPRIVIPSSAFKLLFDINDFPTGRPFLRLSDRHMMESPFDDLLLHT